MSMTELRLTEWTSCGGCAAKWGAALLKDLVAEFPVSTDPSLLIGLAPFDDAAIYQVSDDVAIVSTTDFFPPLVDDPADFGAIAAANACSDVFAMGGRVVMAINVAAFPEHFPREAIVAIFEAGSEGGRRGGRRSRRGAHHPQPRADLRARRAGGRPPRPHLPQGRRPAGRRPRAVEAARHRPDARDRHARTEGRCDRRHEDAQPCGVRALQALGDAVHAVTDVTGYGLAGHGWEMAERSGSAP
jgi:selenide, water dikinase